MRVINPVNLNVIITLIVKEQFHLGIPTLRSWVFQVALFRRIALSLLTFIYGFLELINFIPWIFCTLRQIIIKTTSFQVHNLITFTELIKFVTVFFFSHARWQPSDLIIFALSIVSCVYAIFDLQGIFIPCSILIEFCEGGLLGLCWAAMVCDGAPEGEAVGGEA